MTQMVELLMLILLVLVMLMLMLMLIIGLREEKGNLSGPIRFEQGKQINKTEPTTNCVS